MDERPARKAAGVLDRQSAARHLIHASIRMILGSEDVFAIHVLANSADTMLRALVKASGEPDHTDWDHFIRPGMDFYKHYRAIPNFLKHADRDPFGTVEVLGEVRIVELMTLLNVERYRILYGNPTQHMLQYIAYLVSVWSPDLWTAGCAPLNFDKLRTAMIDETVGFSREISRELLMKDFEAEQERLADLGEMREANAILVRDYGQ